MSGLTETLEGYQISRLEHSLQSATRAHKNGESEEMVVAALLHDIGDELAPMNHSEYAAAILKPTNTKEVSRILKLANDNKIGVLVITNNKNEPIGITHIQDLLKAGAV